MCDETYGYNFIKVIPLIYEEFIAYHTIVIQINHRLHSRLRYVFSTKDSQIMDIIGFDAFSGLKNTNKLDGKCMLTMTKGFITHSFKLFYFYYKLTVMCLYITTFKCTSYCSFPYVFDMHSWLEKKSQVSATLLLSYTV